MSNDADIAALGIKVDSSEAAGAADDLDRLTSSAASAQKAAEGNSKSFSQAAEALGEFAAHARAHTLALLGANEETRAFTGILAHLPLPILGVAAVVAALTVAYAQGAEESRQYAIALAQSGNAAGTTASQLASYAAQIGKVSGNTGQAAQALGALVATGAVGQQDLQAFATAAVQAHDTIGTAYADIAKQFQALAEAPLDAAVEMNKQLGNLTPALYQEILALQQQGKVTDAARVAQTAFSEALQSQAKQLEDSKGYWDRFKDSVSNAWDSVKSIGRSPSLEDQLSNLQAQRGNRPLGTLTPGFDTTQQLLNDRAEQILTAQIASQHEQAQATAEQVEANKQFIISQAQVNAALQARDTVNKAQTSLNLDNVQRSFSAAQQAIQQQDDVLQAQHDALLLTDQQYYDAKAKLIESGTQAELIALNREAAIIKQQLVDNAQEYSDLRKKAASPSETVELNAQELTARLGLENQLAAIVARRGQLTQDNAAKATALNIEEAASLKRVTDAYDDLYFSTQRYNEQLSRQYLLTEQGIGAGDQSRQRAGELANIQDHFTQQQQSLDDQLRTGSITQDQHDNRQQILQEGLKAAEDSFKKHYDVLDQQQSNWLNGAKEALNNYVDAAKNVANLADQAFTSAFQSMEDAIVGFATTGKFSFKDLATSIVADLVRMEVKILESQALQSIFGAFGLGAAGGVGATSGVGELTGSTLGFAAGGGNISGPTIVGEKGPELFVPNSAGTVIPNNKLGSLGGPQVNITNHNSFAAGSDVAGLSAELDRRDSQIMADVYENLRRSRWSGAVPAR